MHWAMKPLALSFLGALLTSTALALSACSGASNGLGGNGNGNQSCTTVPCGTGGGSYQVCVAANSGSCAMATYSVNGNAVGTCDPCTAGSCNQVTQQVVAACTGTSGDGGGGTDGSVGNETCSNATPCGTSGKTYKECTATDPGTGECKSIDYKTSDGKVFTCSGCQSCGAVAQELASYCAGDFDSGSGMKSCTSSVACGSGGATYVECTTTDGTGACTSIDYELSNGVTFTCASCGNCTSAVNSLNSFCQGQGNPTTSCSSWTTCGTSSLQYEVCTTSVNGACQAQYYETSDGQMYSCAACGNCTSAASSMESYCASQTSSTSCGTATSCGSTGVTSQLCTTSQGGTCQMQYYQTSDGQTFSCSSCSSCSAAATSLSSYCSSLSGTTCGSTSCSTGYLCCNCSGTLGCYTSNSGQYTCSSYGCQ